MLNLCRSYHKLKWFQCDRTAHKKSALTNTLSVSSENYLSTNSSPPILYLLLSHLEKKFSYLTSTNLYIIVTTDVTNAGRGTATNLLRMLQKIFHRFKKSQTKALKHFGKFCSIPFPFSLLQCLCSPVTLQSHLNIAEGKGRAKVFQGFWARIVVVSESLLSQSLSRSKVVQMQVLLFKRRKDFFLTIRNT